MATMLWPTLTVRDVEGSVAFYTRMLGFTSDFSLQDGDGRTFIARVERGDAMVMFERPVDDTPTDDRLQRVKHGLTLTFLLDESEDLDVLYNRVRAAGVRVIRDIGDRYWGNRDFTIKDPDGYLLTFAKERRAVSPEELQAIARAQSAPRQ